MTGSKVFRCLDVSVGVSLGAIFLASVCATFVADREALDRWLAGHFMLMALFALGECLLILGWMIAGGQRSSLWEWFPPLCMFPQALWLRWLVALGLIAGTIAGFISMELARTDEQRQNGVSHEGVKSALVSLHAKLYLPFDRAAIDTNGVWLVDAFTVLKPQTERLQG